MLSTSSPVQRIGASDYYSTAPSEASLAASETVVAASVAASVLVSGAPSCGIVMR